MLKMLYSDFRRLLRNKILTIAAPILAVVYAFFMVGMDRVTSMILDQSIEYGDISLSEYPSIAALVLGIIAGLYTTTDFTEGTIRNKISTGAQRKHIFLSSCVISSITAFVLQLVYTCSTIIFSNVLLKGMLQEPKDLWILFLVYSMAGISIAVLFTSVVFICGSSKVSYIVCPAIAMVFRILSLIVLDKLYPSNGICTLTGIRLQVYTFLDRFCPFLYLNGFTRWDAVSYLCGNLGLIVLSLAAAILIFDKKEIQ